MPIRPRSYARPRPGISPIVSVLSALQARAREDEERELLQGIRERREQRLEQQGARQELEFRLGLETHPALAPVAPGQERRSVESYVAPGVARRAFGGAPSLHMEMPIDETLSYGKRRYAIRGPKERLGRKMREAEALANVKAMAAGDEARKKLEREGLLVSGEDLNKLSIQGGTRRIMPKDLSAIATFGETLRDLQQPAEEKQPRPFIKTTERGTYLISPKGKVTEARTPEGKAIRQPKATETGLAAARFAEQKRQSRQRELERIEDKEQELYEARTVIAQQLLDITIQLEDADKDAKKILNVQRKINEARYKAKTDALRTLLKSKVRKGFTTEAEAQLAIEAPATTTGQGQANSWKEYKRQQQGVQ